MKIKGANLLVTGSNRGLGRALVEAALVHGAGKVYAAARDPAGIAASDPRVRPVALDLTDSQSVAELSALCADTDIIINNAASLANSSAFRAPDLEAGRLEMETNYWGLLRVTRAFAPGLAARDGGAIVNILSIGALASVPFCSSYCASKAAAWSLTQSTRAELARQGTKVVAVFPGPIATEMARAHQQEGRCPPEVMANDILSSIAKGEEMIFPDAVSAGVAQLYGSSPWALERQLSVSMD